MKICKLIPALCALFLAPVVFSGCASVKSSLADESTRANYATMIKGAGSTAAALALGQFDSDTAKQARIAKTLVIVADAIRVAAQDTNATPATLKAAVAKALCNESAAYVTAVNSAMTSALALYAQYYNEAVAQKLADNVVLLAAREFLVALAEGIYEVALPYSGLAASFEEREWARHAPPLVLAMTIIPGERQI